MAAVRRTVRLGHAARAAAKAKVRQPLRRAVVVANEDERAAIEARADLVTAELNVKELDFVADEGELVSYEVKPNYRALGPRFGKKMPQVAAAVAALDPRHVAEVMAAGGEVGIAIDGHDHTLGPDELTLALQPARGLRGRGRGRPRGGAAAGDRRRSCAARAWPGRSSARSRTRAKRRGSRSPTGSSSGSAATRSCSRRPPTTRPTSPARCWRTAVAIGDGGAGSGREDRRAGATDLALAGLRTIAASLPVRRAALRAAPVALALSALAALALLAAPRTARAAAPGLGGQKPAPKPQLILLHGGSFLFEDPYFEPLTRPRAIAAGFVPHYVTYPLGDLPAAVTAVRHEARRLRETGRPRPRLRLRRLGRRHPGGDPRRRGRRRRGGRQGAGLRPRTWEWPLRPVRARTTTKRSSVDPEARIRLSPFRRPAAAAAAGDPGPRRQRRAAGDERSLRRQVPPRPSMGSSQGVTRRSASARTLSRRAMRWLAQIADRHARGQEEGNAAEANRLP